MTHALETLKLRLKAEWQKERLWWKSLPKKQKAWLILQAFFLVFALAFVIIGIFAFKAVRDATQNLDYSNPTVLKSTYQIAWFAICFDILLGSVLIGTYLLLRASNCYTYYLELRIKELEEWRKEIEEW